MAIKIMEKSKKTYQLSCLFSPRTDTAKIEQESGEIKKWIEKNEGELVASEAHKETAVRKQLAYPIGKQQEAFFWFVSFSLKPQKLDELSQYLSSNHDIIRYMVSTEKKTEAKAAKKSFQRSQIDLGLANKLVDRIDPLHSKKPSFDEQNADAPANSQEPVTPTKEEKADIDKLDEKLEEILNQ